MSNNTILKHDGGEYEQVNLSELDRYADTARQVLIEAILGIGRAFSQDVAARNTSDEIEAAAFYLAVGRITRQAGNYPPLQAKVLSGKLNSTGVELEQVTLREFLDRVMDEEIAKEHHR